MRLSTHGAQEKRRKATSGRMEGWKKKEKREVWVYNEGKNSLQVALYESARCEAVALYAADASRKWHWRCAANVIAHASIHLQVAPEIACHCLGWHECDQHLTAAVADNYRHTPAHIH